MITNSMAQNMSSKDGDAGQYETEGAPGQKEPTPGPEPSESNSSDGGNWNTAAQAANAAQHNRPAVSADPDNITGSIDSPAGPTKGEGAEVGPVDYNGSVGGGQSYTAAPAPHDRMANGDPMAYS